MRYVSWDNILELSTARLQKDPIILELLEFVRDMSEESRIRLLDYAEFLSQRERALAKLKS